MEINIIAFVGLGIVSFCLGLYRLANGKMKEKIDRTACHSAMNGIREIGKNDRRHINNRFDGVEKRIDDLKDFFIKNGIKK